MKETLYIIDISNMMHRAFHVHKHLATSAGFPVGAIYGTFTMLYKWIQDVHPKNILICYDWQGEGSVRKNIYPQYKANRVQVNAVSAQELIIRRMLADLGMSSIEMPGYEADDLIASSTLQFKSKYNIVIISSDKDLMQLVEPGVEMFDAMKKKVYHEEDVIEKFGVRPDQILDYLSIVGDAADNIPGVKGIGKKGACELLEKFQSLEKIYDSIEDVKGVKRDKLEKSRDVAFMSKKLATLYNNLQVLSNFNIQFHPKNNKELINLFKTLEFGDDTFLKLNNLWSMYK